MPLLGKGIGRARSLWVPGHPAGSSFTARIGRPPSRPARVGEVIRSVTAQPRSSDFAILSTFVRVKGKLLSEERSRSGRARPRSRRGQGGQLAEDILIAAAAIVDETGDESRVTLSEIARRVGIAVPSIYPHFSGVSEICQKVVVRAWESYLLAITVDRDDSAPVRDQIRQVAFAYVGFARRTPGMYRLLFARLGPSSMPTVHDQAGESLGELVSAMAVVLHLEPDSEAARDAAIGLWIQLHGIAVLPPAHPRFSWPDDRTLISDALRRSGVGDGSR